MSDRASHARKTVCSREIMDRRAFVPVHPLAALEQAPPVYLLDG